MYNIDRMLTVIRYETSLLVDDARTRNDILKKMRSNFPIHDFNQPNNTMFFVNPSKNVKCIIGKNELTFDIDQPPNFNFIKTQVNDVVEDILRRLDIQSTSFIGVRSFIITERITEKDKVDDIIIKKFFSKELIDFLSINSLVAKQPTLGYSIDLNSELSMNVNISLNQKGRGEIDASGQLNIIEIIETNPQIDLDIHTRVPKEIKQINGVIKAALSKMEQYHLDAWNLKNGSVTRS